MNAACRRSPTRYINLLGSLPKYPRPSLALTPYSERTMSHVSSTGEPSELPKCFEYWVSCFVLVASPPPPQAIRVIEAAGAARRPPWVSEAPCRSPPLPGACSQVASRAQGSARRYPTPRMAPRTPSPRSRARPRPTTGAGARLGALGGDNGAVVVARCTRALRGSPVIR
jgi:hypothetical protein